MNREQAKALLPYIIAFSEGKDVQHKAAISWQSSEDIGFADVPENYRIKPKPRKWRLCWDGEQESVRAYPMDTNPIDFDTSETPIVVEVIE